MEKKNDNLKAMFDEFNEKYFSNSIASDWTVEFTPAKKTYLGITYHHNKLIRIKARENWANAEARYYRVLADDITTAHTGYDVHGKVVIDVMSCPNCRAPVDWEHIWKRVAHRLHQYHKRLTLQQFYGRNPKDVAMFTPKVLVEKE